MTNQPLTKDNLHEAYDLNSDNDVMWAHEVRSAVEGLRKQFHERTEDEEPLCGWEVEQAFNYWFPVFAKNKEVRR